MKDEKPLSIPIPIPIPIPTPIFLDCGRGVSPILTGGVMTQPILSLTTLDSRKGRPRLGLHQGFGGRRPDLEPTRMKDEPTRMKDEG